MLTPNTSTHVQQRHVCIEARACNAHAAQTVANPSLTGSRPAGDKAGWWRLECRVRIGWRCSAPKAASAVQGWAGAEAGNTCDCQGVRGGRRFPQGRRACMAGAGAARGEGAALHRCARTVRVAAGPHNWQPPVPCTRWCNAQCSFGIIQPSMTPSRALHGCNQAHTQTGLAKLSWCHRCHQGVTGGIGVRALFAAS